jgi:hypothetical protein
MAMIRAQTEPASLRPAAKGRREHQLTLESDRPVNIRRAQLRSPTSVTRFGFFLVLLVALAPAGQLAPVATSRPSNAHSTIPSAVSSPAAAVPTPVATEDASASAELADLVAAMASAVIDGDLERYLDLVDLSDPVFAIEHTRWVEDWAGRDPATTYSLSLAGVAVDGDSAVGLLTVEWSTDPIPSDNPTRLASFAARFTRGTDGWRYAGEDWTSTQTERFIVRVAPGLEAAGQAIADDLPGIYADVTAALGYEPAGSLEIKLYADSPSLVANTLLSLPDIAGWNEPGEALKLVNRSDGPSLAPTIAHELTHFLGFDRAGTQRSRMPWWLDEGIATYVGSHVAGTPEDGRLAQVIVWEAGGELAPWVEMEVFEETPLDLWPYVYSQGYAMVRFISEELGVDRRNAWLAAMATEMDIDEATSAVLGRSFERLDRNFREWLAAQR